MCITYLLLGSNLGDSVKYLADASSLIGLRLGSILAKSSLYRTASWGKHDQPDFINQVIVVETSLEAEEMMQTILIIEEEMGRVRTKKNAARTIDIDILFFNKEIIKSISLVIPHPFIRDRRFVLVPLNELSARFIHPVLKKSIQQLLKQCPDKLDVKRI